MKMFGILHRSNGLGFRRDATNRRAILGLAAVVLALVAVPATAQAAFTVSGFSFSPSAAQAGGHPTITFKLTRGGTNAEDLKNIKLTLPKGLHFNPQAALYARSGGATAKCLDAEFSADVCPAATNVGTISASIRRDSGTSSGTTSTVTGSIYVLEASGADDMVIGYVFRPSGWGAKTYVKQLVEVRSDNDTTVTGTNTINSLQTLTWVFPQMFGTTNITFLNFTNTYRARADSSISTGPYFVWNPSDCVAKSTALTATSSGGVSYTPTAATYTTPTGCTNTSLTPAPTLTTTVSNSSAGQSTGVTTNVSQSMASATIQRSTLKTINQQLPIGTSFNTAGFSSLTPCTESQLAADTCPTGSKVGSAQSQYPFYPTTIGVSVPSWGGDIYLMSVTPASNAATFAYVLRGDRGMKSIMRSSAGNTGTGTSARAFNNYSYMSNFPWSALTTTFTTPLIVNQTACPSTGTVNTAVVGYQSTTAVNLTGTYGVTCPVMIPNTTLTSSPASLTNDNTPTVGLSSDIGTASFEYAVDGSSGPWFACSGTGTSNCTTSALADGSHTLYFRAFTASGPDATPVQVALTVDTIAPAVPALTAPANGSFVGVTPTVSGTADPGATVRVYDGVAQVCTVTATAGGTWSCVTSSLAQGPHTLYATAGDPAGNISGASNSVSVNVDTVAPPAPSIASPANATTTNNATVAISGSAENGSTVKVYEGGSLICTTTAASGSWTCTPPAFSSALHSITATATDSAGNVSPASSAVTFTVDSTPPAAPVITSPANGSTTTDNTPTISGTAEGSSTVRVYNGGGNQICNVTAAADGSWSCTSSALTVSASHTITAKATDAAGNTGVASAGVTFTIYSTAPETQLTVGPDGDAPDMPNGWPITIAAPTWEFTSPNSSGASFECQLDSTSGSWTACTSPLNWDQIETLNFDIDRDGTIQASNSAGQNETGEHRLYIRAVSGSSTDSTPEVSHFNVSEFSPVMDAGTASTQSGANADLNLDLTVPAGNVKSLTTVMPPGLWFNRQALTGAALCSAAVATSSGSCPVGSKVGEFNVTYGLNRAPHTLSVPPHSLTIPGTMYLTEDLDGTTADPDPEIYWAIIVADVQDSAAYSAIGGGGNYGRVIMRAQIVATDDLNADSVSNPSGNTLLMDNVPKTSSGPSGTVELRLAQLSGQIDAVSPGYAAPLVFNPSACGTAEWHSGLATYESELLAGNDHNSTIDSCESTSFTPALNQFSLTPSANGPGLELHTEFSMPAGDATLQTATIDLPPSVKQRDAALQYQCARHFVDSPTYGETGVDPNPTCADVTRVGTIEVTSPLLPVALSGGLFIERTGAPVPNIYGAVQDDALGIDMRLRAWASTASAVPGGNEFVRLRMNADVSSVAVGVPSMPISKVKLDITGSNSVATSAGCNLDDEYDENGNPVYNDACPAGQHAIFEVGPGCLPSDAGTITLESWSGKTAGLVSPEVANASCPEAAQLNDRLPLFKQIVGDPMVPEVVNGGLLSGSVTSGGDTTFTFEKEYRNNTVYSSFSTKRQRVWFECSYDGNPWVVCDATSGNSVNLTNATSPGSFSGDNVLNCGETTTLRGSFTTPAPSAGTSIRRLAIRLRSVTGTVASQPCNSTSTSLNYLPAAIAGTGNGVLGVNQRIWRFDPTAP